VRTSSQRVDALVHAAVGRSSLLDDADRGFSGRYSYGRSPMFCTDQARHTAPCLGVAVRAVSRQTHGPCSLGAYVDDGPAAVTTSTHTAPPAPKGRPRRRPSPPFAPLEVPSPSPSPPSCWLHRALRLITANLSRRMCPQSSPFTIRITSTLERSIGPSRRSSADTLDAVERAPPSTESSGHMPSRPIGSVARHDA